MVDVIQIMETPLSTIYRTQWRCMKPPFSLPRVWPRHMLANPPLEMLSAFRLRGCFVKPTFKHIVYFPPTTGISNIAPEYFLNLSQIHIHVDFFFLSYLPEILRLEHTRGTSPQNTKTWHKKSQIPNSVFSYCKKKDMFYIIYVKKNLSGCNYRYFTSSLTKQSYQPGQCRSLKSAWQQDDIGSNAGTEKKTLGSMFSNWVFQKHPFSKSSGAFGD